jgi:excisionase family DNA binding protein
VQAANCDLSRQVPPPEPRGECLLRFPAVAERVSLSRTTIYESIRAGSFPAPVKTGRGSRWLASEINAWISACAEARTTRERRSPTAA